MEKTLEQIKTDCIKVVLYGPESTGKSTLSKALAEHYKTAFVPEYARTYLQVKWDQHSALCTKEDLKPIAMGQMKLENERLQSANKLLICDTDLLQTKVYSEVYYNGYCDPKIAYHATRNSYDLYFLCAVDIPWVPDDLRDKPNERGQMFSAFKNELEKQNLHYVLLEGSHKNRMDIATKHIDTLLG
ncbi:MAG: nicotinate-nucleotide adenylyltransferase [Flavobacteriaceae bacterium]|nr:nicotinate-nucleotide adenylyltransferase [Flavobacteriaceae bacterium]